jgi:protein-L-isoaspartate(D-aspartate) O-methyltransferase
LRTRHHDGRLGWAEHAPFDAIIVTAGAAALVPELLDQLADGGTLVAPVGGASAQKLLRVRKTAEGSIQEDLGSVVFVPLVSGTL